MTDGAFHGGEPRGQLREARDCSSIVSVPFAALSERRWPRESDHRDAIAAAGPIRVLENILDALSSALGSSGEAPDRGREKAVKQIHPSRGPTVRQAGYEHGHPRPDPLVPV